MNKKRGRPESLILDPKTGKLLNLVDHLWKRIEEEAVIKKTSQTALIERILLDHFYKIDLESGRIKRF